VGIVSNWKWRTCHENRVSDESLEVYRRERNAETERKIDERQQERQRADLKIK
jgi:hypothetical protein